MTGGAPILATPQMFSQNHLQTVFFCFFFRIYVHDLCLMVEQQGGTESIWEHGADTRN